MRSCFAAVTIRSTTSWISGLTMTFVRTAGRSTRHQPRSLSFALSPPVLRNSTANVHTQSEKSFARVCDVRSAPTALLRSPRRRTCSRPVNCIRSFGHVLPRIDCWSLCFPLVNTFEQPLYLKNPGIVSGKPRTHINCTGGDYFRSLMRRILARRALPPTEAGWRLRQMRASPQTRHYFRPKLAAAALLTLTGLFGIGPISNPSAGAAVSASQCAVPAELSRLDAPLQRAASALFSHY
jgi:hypothetical protein